MIMKYLNYLTILFCLPLIIACNKSFGDDLGVDNADSFSMVYTINAIEDNSKNTMVIPMNIDTIFAVYANWGGIFSPAQDIQVKFRIAPELVGTYNDDNQTSYPLMLDGSYKVENYEAIIKKGELTSSPIDIKIDSKAFDGIGKFLLPVHIESVSPEITINDKLRTAYLLINGYYDSNPFQMYDRALWSIAGFSTDENESNSTYPQNGRAISAIDNANLSFWCSQWRSAKPGPPHWLAIDMGEAKELHGVVIRGRSDSKDPNVAKSNGNPRIFHIDVSNDNINWERAGDYAVDNILEYPVYFDHKKTARYFKITVTATQADFYGTHIAEVYAF